MDAEDLLNTPAIRELYASQHKDSMRRKSYRDGFYAKDGDENPHPFPIHVNLRMMRIGSTVGPLSEEQITELRALHKIYDSTNYNFWARGYHARRRFSE